MKPLLGFTWTVGPEETNRPIILLASIKAPPPLFLKSNITASTSDALKTSSIFFISLLLLLKSSFLF